MQWEAAIYNSALDAGHEKNEVSGERTAWKGGFT